MKVELIKETKPNGEVLWYTKSDGVFISGTLSFDEQEAIIKHDYFIVNCEPSKEEVIKTTEIYFFCYQLDQVSIKD